MPKLTARQVSQLTKEDLKKWLTDRDQKLPKSDHSKDYYVERVLEYQSAHENEDNDIDMGPQTRKRSNRNTPSRLVNKRKTPIRSRRHSEMPSDTPVDRPIKFDGRMTRSRRKTLDPGELARDEDKRSARSKRNTSKKHRGLSISKPARDMKKAELQEWLFRNDIPYQSSMLKADLVQLVERHAMAPPDTPPKKIRTIAHPHDVHRPGPAVGSRKSPKRQLDDKPKPSAKRTRHSYRSQAMQSLLDSTDDDGDEKIPDTYSATGNDGEKPPVTPRTSRDNGPLPPNLDMSPLTPQHPQSTVEKQASPSPPLPVQSSMLTTPALSRRVRQQGPKQITEVDRFQIRSEIRGLLDDVDEPTKPLSTYSRPPAPAFEDEMDAMLSKNRRGAQRDHREEKEDLSRSLDFRHIGDSDVDDEKTDIMTSKRLPNPPPEIMEPLTHRPQKRLHRRASAPSEIPQMHIQFDPRTRKQTGKNNVKSALNWLLGAIVFAVMAFVVFVFFNVESTVRFCDTGKLTIGNWMDTDGTPVQCTECPQRAACTEGVAVCDTQYVLMGTECVLNKAVVQAGYEIRSQAVQILGEIRGRYECGEDIERGYSDGQLKDLLVLTDPSLLDEAFDYFKANIFTNTATLSSDLDGKLVSTRPIKSFACQTKEWMGDNKFFVCVFTFFVLLALSIGVRLRRQRQNNKMAESLKSYIMDVLQSRGGSTREKYIPIDILKSELKPSSDVVWNLVIEMMKHEHNVVKQEKMVQGVQRSCWEMTNVSVPRRQRASLDSALGDQWRIDRRTDNHAAQLPAQTWSTTEAASNNFGADLRQERMENRQNFSPVSQQEGFCRTGDVPATELFDQNRRRSGTYSAQEFMSSNSQPDGDAQAGFQLRSFPVTSSNTNW